VIKTNEKSIARQHYEQYYRHYDKMAKQHFKKTLNVKVTFSEPMWLSIKAISEALKMTGTQFIKMAVQHELERQLKLLRKLKVKSKV
jgi:BarA-like signal transduction histidine kinase